MNEESIRAKASIFGKSAKKLSKYQTRINEATGHLCVENPSLLADRAKLFDLAQDAVQPDYQFARGKSRSKKVAPSESRQPKREKNDSEERCHRMTSLQERIQDTNKHITLKERRVEQAQGSQNFKLCDQLMVEVDSLKKTRGEVESALRAFAAKRQAFCWLFC